MRYAVLGDIHGNLEALDTVLAYVDATGVDRVLQVGDVVGYGADPSICIQRLRERNAVVVAGNHDWAVVGKLDLSCFNPAARQAVEWTRGRLDDASIAYLESLPLAVQIDGGISLAHASPEQPELFDYILDYDDAMRAMKCFDTPVCFIGHSHVPVTFILEKTLTHTLEPEVTIPEGARSLVNVGSVGQPRDECPDAAVAIYDTATRTCTLARLAYDIDACAAKIRAAGLPGILAERLYVGK